MEICGVLLAAGIGSRFGGAKLLHPLVDGTPLGVAAARNLLAAVSDVVAVVRTGDFPLADLLEAEGCRIGMCADASRGMGASLAYGVGMCRNAHGWLVALADMPRIKPETISSIAQRLMAGADLVAPVYQGRRGHPVGISRRFRTDLTALGDDFGARELIAAHRNELVLVDGEDDGVVHDVDRREDLLK